MTTRFPLEPLLFARRVRRDGAFERVRERRAEVRTLIETRDAIVVRLQRTSDLRAACAGKLALLADEGGGACALEYGRAEEHIALLDERANDIRAEIARADEAIAAARERLQQAIQEFMRAQARLDAIEEQKSRWKDARARDLLRGEENASEDLLVNRYAKRS